MTNTDHQESGASARADVSMSLGAHLEELRWRLIKPIILLVVAVVVSFAFSAELKRLFEYPLRRALTLVDPDVLAKLAIDPDPDRPLLTALSLVESPITAVKVSLVAALLLTFPTFVYQLWRFVTPALNNQERRAGFWMVPAAVIFFYGGVVFGYAIGLPWFYKFSIDFTANYFVELDLRETEYLSFFTMLTIAFGVVMVIPWLMLILVRSGLISTEAIAAKRRIMIVIIAIAAAMLSPPDPISQLALIAMMLVLFEAGLLMCRFLAGSHKASPAASTTPAPAAAPTTTSTTAPAATSGIDRDYSVADEGGATAPSSSSGDQQMIGHRDHPDLTSAEEYNQLVGPNAQQPLVTDDAEDQHSQQNDADIAADVDDVADNEPDNANDDVADNAADDDPHDPWSPHRTQPRDPYA